MNFALVFTGYITLVGAWTQTNWFRQDKKKPAEPQTISALPWLLFLRSSDLSLSVSLASRRALLTSVRPLCLSFASRQALCARPAYLCVSLTSGQVLYVHPTSLCVSFAIIADKLFTFIRPLSPSLLSFAIIADRLFTFSSGPSLLLS